MCHPLISVTDIISYLVNKMTQKSCSVQDCLLLGDLIVRNASHLGNVFATDITIGDSIFMTERDHIDHHDFVIQCIDANSILHDRFILHCPDATGKNCPITLPGFAQVHTDTIGNGVVMYNGAGDLCPITFNALALIIGSGHIDVCQAIIDTPGCIEHLCIATVSSEECVDAIAVALSDNDIFRDSVCNVVTTDCIPDICTSIISNQQCVNSIGHAVTPIVLDPAHLCPAILNGCIDEICTGLIADAQCVEDLGNAIINNTDVVNTLIGNTIFREGICDIVTTDCISAPS